MLRCGPLSTVVIGNQGGRLGGAFDQWRSPDGSYREDWVALLTRVEVGFRYQDDFSDDG
jgi:hypothetical protein